MVSIQFFLRCAILVSPTQADQRHSGVQIKTYPFCWGAYFKYWWAYFLTIASSPSAPRPTRRITLKDYVLEIVSNTSTRRSFRCHRRCSLAGGCGCGCLDMNMDKLNQICSSFSGWTEDRAEVCWSNECLLVDLVFQCVHRTHVEFRLVDMWDTRMWKHLMVTNAGVQSSVGDQRWLGVQRVFTSGKFPENPGQMLHVLLFEHPTNVGWLVGWHLTGVTPTTNTTTTTTTRKQTALSMYKLYHTMHYSTYYNTQITTWILVVFAVFDEEPCLMHSSANVAWWQPTKPVHGT